MDFRIDIEDAAGIKQGSGPITSAQYWRYTGRMDRAGSFSFAMPCSDPKAASVQKKRKARAYALLGGLWAEVGAGIIDNIQEMPQADGKVILAVSGDDELRELNYRTVGYLELALAGSAVEHVVAVATLELLAPSGWAFVADSSPPNDFIYARFAGESVLQAAIAVANKTQTHFYRSGAQTLTYASDFASSGVRAIRANGNLATSQAAIVGLSRQVNTYDLITRIYPFGAGNGRARLTLAATDRVAPSGFTLSAVSNYIENDAAVATYGVIEQYVEFKDVAPVSNTDADLEAAANMLFDMALEELRRRSTELEQATYTLRLAQCAQLLTPMQTIRLIYRDNEAGLEIDEELNILEASLEATVNGLYTTDLIVSTADRWPPTDVSTLVSEMAQGRAFESHPQLNANSYVTGYSKNVDDTLTASLRFRFGSEVVQLQQVLVEFQLLQFESTIKSVSSDSPTSSSGGGSTQAASSGGNHSHTVTIASHSHTVTVPGHSHTVTVASHSHTVTVSAHSHTVTVAGHSHTVTISSHNHTLTIPAHSHTVTVASHSHTVTIAAHSHTVTVAGHSHSVTIPGHFHTITLEAHSHTVTTPSHDHDIPVYDSSTPGSPSNKDLFIDISNEIFVFFNTGSDAIENLVTSEESASFSHSSTTKTFADFTSDFIGIVNNSSTATSDTTPSSSTLTQSTPSSSTLTQSTPTSSELAEQTRTASTLSSSFPTSNELADQSSSSSTLTQSTPSSSTLTQTTPTSNITADDAVSSVAAGSSSPTSTTDGSHTHSVTIAAHTHSISPAITTVYGIFRESLANTYAIADLEYQVNGGGYSNLNVAEVLAGGWYSLDITSEVMDSVTFRPIDADNTMDIRRKASAATGKTVTINAQLSVRNIIQAIAYV